MALEISDYQYNPWPLGNLPEEWKRPEPEQLRNLGYSWSDPRDIVDIFEQKIAKFAGSKYAVTVDSCSHAIFLSLKFRGGNGELVIPRNTYASVPMQVLHAGYKPVFSSKEWVGTYPIGSSGVIDGAGRFRPGMYEGNGALHTLSFQIKKRLPIGRGGAILTDSQEAYNWLKRSSYDGRDLKSPYDSKDHIGQLGWHFYMTPEDAARGVILMDLLGSDYSDTMWAEMYPDLSKSNAFKDLRTLEEERSDV